MACIRLYPYRANCGVGVRTYRIISILLSLSIITGKPHMPFATSSREKRLNIRLSSMCGYASFLKCLWDTWIRILELQIVEFSALNVLSLSLHFFFCSCFRNTDFYLSVVFKIVVMRRGFAMWEAEKLSRTSGFHSGGSLSTDYTALYPRR
jgi:hypothetical protein